MPSHFTCHIRKMYLACILLLSSLLSWQSGAAQCNGTIATYPYMDDFETSTTGWTTSGLNSDWAWGTPNKKIIKSAASGTKCWITGGLTKNTYNNKERSYLQSPCFNLAALHYPYIRFKLFCDTERDWDGANLQYSPDNARTWIKIGYFGQPEDCFNSDWYNTRSVYYLAEEDGWSDANTNGGKWMTAQIKLPFTGGTGKTIMFRFYFGSGDTNNDFDGFAIDDFYMGEAPDSVSASFNYMCISASVVNFTAEASPCLTNLQWDFGDAASGNANKASGVTALHKFSATGKYQVNLTASDNNGNNIIKTSEINIIAASINISTPVQCAGGTATVQAVVQGADIPYLYRWNTTPEITTAKAALHAGNYTIEVSAENTCTAQVPLVIGEPPPLLTSMTVVQPNCNKSNGSMFINVSGGTAPYTYNWQPVVSNTNGADNLQSGNYNITVTDHNGCTAPIRAVLQPKGVQVSLGNDTSICYGQTLTLYAGNFASYLWDDLSNLPQRTINKAGVYFVKVTTTDGCSANDTIKVIGDCGDVYFPSAFTPNGDLINDAFGPAGNVSLLKNYTLHIYDRLGNLVFKSSTPLQKWSGEYKNGVIAGTYVYIAIYEYNGVKKIKKGNIVLLL